MTKWRPAKSGSSTFPPWPAASHGSRGTPAPDQAPGSGAPDQAAGARAPVQATDFPPWPTATPELHHRNTPAPVQAPRAKTGAAPGVDAHDLPLHHRTSQQHLERPNQPSDAGETATTPWTWRPRELMYLLVNQQACRGPMCMRTPNASICSHYIPWALCPYSLTLSLSYHTYP